MLASPSSALDTVSNAVGQPSVPPTAIALEGSSEVADALSAACAAISNMWAFVASRDATVAPAAEPAPVTDPVFGSLNHITSPPPPPLLPPLPHRQEQLQSSNQQEEQLQQVSQNQAEGHQQQQREHHKQCQQQEPLQAQPQEHPHTQSQQNGHQRALRPRQTQQQLFPLPPVLQQRHSQRQEQQTQKQKQLHPSSPALRHRQQQPQAQQREAQQPSPLNQRNGDVEQGQAPGTEHNEQLAAPGGCTGPPSHHPSQLSAGGRRTGPGKRPQKTMSLNQSLKGSPPAVPKGAPAATPAPVSSLDAAVVALVVLQRADGHGNTMESVHAKASPLEMPAQQGGKPLIKAARGERLSSRTTAGSQSPLLSPVSSLKGRAPGQRQAAAGSSLADQPVQEPQIGSSGSSQKQQQQQQEHLFQHAPTALDTSEPAGKRGTDVSASKPKGRSRSMAAIEPGRMSAAYGRGTLTSVQPEDNGGRESQVPHSNNDEAVISSAEKRSSKVLSCRLPRREWFCNQVLICIQA